MEYKINTSQLREYANILKCKDRVLLSGTVYTSRDAAHKRIVNAIENNEKLPYS